MNTSNIKDTLSTICGLLFVISGSILGASSQGIILPPVVVTIAGVVTLLSGGIIGWLTGKTPSGTTKSTSEIVQGNDGTNNVGAGNVGTTKP